MRKIKYVCRPAADTFSMQLFVDEEAYAEAFDAVTSSAREFFGLFSPESMMEKYTAQYGKDFVLVFRTDESQMQEFAALLAEHGNAC